jgi:hypothetical protein
LGSAALLARATAAANGRAAIPLLAAAIAARGGAQAKSQVPISATAAFAAFAALGSAQAKGAGNNLSVITPGGPGFIDQPPYGISIHKLPMGF